MALGSLGGLTINLPFLCFLFCLPLPGLGAILGFKGTCFLCNISVFQGRLEPKYPQLYCIAILLQP